MEPIHSPSLGLVTCKKKKVHRGRARPAVLIAHCAPSENSEAAFILCFVAMRKRHPTGRSQGFTFVPKARLKRVFVFRGHAYGNAWPQYSIFDPSSPGGCYTSSCFCPFCQAYYAAPTLRANPRVYDTLLLILPLTMSTNCQHTSAHFPNGQRRCAQSISSIANVVHLRCTQDNLSGHCADTCLLDPTRAPAWRNLRRKNPYFLRTLPAFDRTISLCTRR